MKSVEDLIIAEYGSLTNFVTEEYDLKLIKDELKEYGIETNIKDIKKMYINHNRDIVKVILELTRHKIIDINLIK